MTRSAVRFASVILLSFLGLSLLALKPTRPAPARLAGFAALPVATGAQKIAIFAGGCFLSLIHI